MKFNQLTNGLHGEIIIPGDKSISHRSIMFGALAKGITQIDGFLQGADCLSTISCFQKMGITIENKKTQILVYGKGLHGLTSPSSILDCGNSGTTTRLISGILAGQDFDTTLTGDSSIQKRPMKRIIEPLSQMGGKITSLHENDCAPLKISPSKLHGISYHSKVASAQVKSCILLAGLYAQGETQVKEPSLSRNHTEIMLKSFGANLTSKGTTATIYPGNELYGQKIFVPGDISSAAYFITAALLVPNSEVLIKNVGINPTRNGILHVYRQMGANITLLNERNEGGEAVADLLVKSSTLKGITIEGDIIPTLIDEIPIIAIAACMAKGTTTIKDAAELKVKESNRIRVMVDNLSAMGAKVYETDDGMIIEGGTLLHEAVIETYDDHRIAMSFAIASLISEGTVDIPKSNCVTISYPNFFNDLSSLMN